jgi:carbamoyl-phosphate synthase large subunit
MLPAQGAILLSVADRDKPEALPIIKKFSELGYQLYATSGTAALIRAVGLPVKRISKKLGEGHPNAVDIITNGTVNGVINTMSGGRAALRDGFYIRRAAAERRVPCFTSLDTARVAVQALSNGGQSWNVKPVSEYRKGRSGS